MLIDLTLKLTYDQLAEAINHRNPALVGHAGTHFDVMDKTFPLDYTKRKAVVFDVSAVSGRDITESDIDMGRVEKDMFVAFYAGNPEPYGTKTYYADHAQLSQALIDNLLEKEVSVIGLDFAGVRRGTEHIPADQRCADRGVFVVENLRNLEKILAKGGDFTAYTYPLHCSGMTGLTCRVVAEINE